MFAVKVPHVKNFKTPLERATAAINKNTPIETCILLEATEAEGFTITSVDSRTHQLRVRVPEAEVYSPGACILQADTINRLTKNLGDNHQIELQADTEAGQLFIQCGTKIDLALFNDPVDMFPREVEMPTVLTVLDAERFYEAIRKALLLSQKDEFITLVAEEEELKVYTRFGGRMFSRTVLNTDGTTDPWAVAIPTQLISKMPPNLTGAMEICADNNMDTIVFKAGLEHLLVRRLATDTTSFLVDTVIDKKTDKFWITKADDLLADLKRAAIIKDRQGVKLVKERNTLRSSYGSGGRGSAFTNHEMLESSETLVPMNLDPVLLERAAKSLDAVDIVGEQVEEVISSGLPGEADAVFYNLRLTDRDHPDYRSVIVTTLQVD